MSEVVVVVHMLFERGTTDEAVEYVSSIVEKNQNEPGCLKSAMHRDVDDRDVLVVVERWQSREAHDTHLEQDHIHDFAAKTGPLFAGVPRISVCEPMVVGDSTKGSV